MGYDRVMNKTHPPTPTLELITELSKAALAVTSGSDDLLAPVAAMAPVPTEPGQMPSTIEQDEVVYALHMAGYTPSQIAHDLTIKTRERWSGDDVVEACVRVGRINLARTSTQMAYAAQLELDRIEAALKALWSQVQDGNLLATDRFLKLSEAKRNLLGLDAADVKVQLTMGGQDALDLTALSDAELRTLQDLQRKASSAAKQKVVSGRVVVQRS